MKTENVERLTVVTTDEEYGTFDNELLSKTQAFLMELCDSLSPPILIVDMSNTEYFGSAFLEVLFRVTNRLRKQNGDLVLCSPQESSSSIFQTTRLDSYWRIYRTRAEAVDVCKSNGMVTK